MVDKLIRWIIRLLMRHGYRVLDEDEYFGMISVQNKTAKALSGFNSEMEYARKIFEQQIECLNKLDTRITDLEKWQQQAEPRIAEKNELSQAISEWINGEKAPDDGR